MNIQLLPVRSINTGGPANCAGISKSSECARVKRCPYGPNVGVESFTVKFDLSDLLLEDADLPLTVPFGQQRGLL